MTSVNNAEIFNADYADWSSREEFGSLSNPQQRPAAFVEVPNAT